MNPWKFFDQIKCINLKSRNDRYTYCQNLFNTMNISVQFHRVDKHPKGGTFGCFQSHMDIIRDAYMAGAQNCLVFEDDIEQSPYFNIRLVNQAIDFITSNDDWELFYLGPVPEVLKHTTKYVSKNIYKLHSICTHAYVIHRRLMSKMINMPFIDIPIDYIYLYNTSAYGIIPGLFYQRADTSDITPGGYSNSTLRPYFFRGLELYATHINYPVTKLCLVVGIAFILLLLLYLISSSNKLMYLIILFGIIFVLAILIK